MHSFYSPFFFVTLDDADGGKDAHGHDHHDERGEEDGEHARGGAYGERGGWGGGSAGARRSGGQGR